MLRKITEEIKSIFKRDPAARNTLEVILCYPGFQAVLIYRFSNIIWKAKLNLSHESSLISKNNYWN